jgi:hypothetical protein
MKKAGKVSFVTIGNAGHRSSSDTPESVAFTLNVGFMGRAVKM